MPLNKKELKQLFIENLFIDNCFLKLSYSSLDHDKMIASRLDSHLKVKNTSLKEVLETKCFENRQDWTTLISRSTDRSSGEDHCAQ